MNITKLRLSTAGPLIIIVVLVIAFGVLGLASSQFGENNIRTAIKETSRPITTTSAKLLFNPLYNLDVAEINRILSQYVDGVTIVHGAVYDTTGARLSILGETWSPEPDLSARLAQSAIAQNMQVESEFQQYLILVTPVAVGSEVIGVVEFVFDQTAARSATGIAQLNTILVTLGILLLTAASAFVLIRAATVPLGNLAAIAQSMGRGNLSTPIAVQGPFEIASLAQSLENMRVRLEKSYIELEQQVVERTEALNIRTSQLEASSYVSRRAAELSDLRTLLEETVRLITEQLKFYHAGIFLVDPEQQFVVLQSASSIGGQAMLKRGHRLAIGRQGIVGNVAYSRQPRIALNVGTESVYFNNPDLPETRSEMALPLLVRGEVIGVLDIQATEPNAFTENDLNTLQTMADQIAVSIENARLLAESRANLKQLAETTTRTTYDVWQKEATEHSNLFTYTPLGTTASTADLSTQPAQNGSAGTLTLPLVLRGQTIGNIRLTRKDVVQAWSADEQEIAATLATQLSLAMENIRLLEESQQRAAREQIIGELTASFTRSPDVETLLQNAAAEMSRVLNATRTRIELNLEEGDSL